MLFQQASSFFPVPEPAKMQSGYAQWSAQDHSRLHQLHSRQQNSQSRLTDGLFVKAHLKKPVAPVSAGFFVERS